MKIFSLPLLGFIIPVWIGLLEVLDATENWVLFNELKGLIQDIKNDTSAGCTKAHFELAGIFFVMKDKCPPDHSFCLSSSNSPTKPPEEVKLSVPAENISHGQNKMDCALCTSLVDVIRNMSKPYQPRDLSSNLLRACENMALFSHECKQVFFRQRQQFTELGADRYATLSTGDICHAISLCTHDMALQMRRSKSHSILLKSEAGSSGGSADVECTLCFGIGTSAAINLNEVIHERMLMYCNGTGLLQHYCSNLVKENGLYMASTTSPEEAWDKCCTIGLCQRKQRGLFARYITEGRDYSAFLSLPITLVRGTSVRHSILNDPLDGPVIGPMGLMQLDIQNPNQVANLLPTVMNDKLKWLARFGLIANSMTNPDPICGPTRQMSLVADSSETDKYVWRCKQGRRVVKRTVRTGSFFKDSHLTFDQILTLSAYWAFQPQLNYDQIRQANNMANSILSKTTIVDFYNFFREVCQDWCEQNKVLRKIGGPGTIVELDESVLYRAKYNRGRPLMNQRHHVWVFGMIQRDTSNIILEVVDRRNAATLLPIIQDYVLPGTTIMSDMWAAYGGINNLPQGYRHLTVNHRIGFTRRLPAGAAPLPGGVNIIHSNTIEATWASLKWSMKHLKGTNEDLMPTYLFQYMFRRAHKNDKIFQNLWYWVAIFYPV